MTRLSFPKLPLAAGLRGSRRRGQAVSRQRREGAGQGAANRATAEELMSTAWEKQLYSGNRGITQLKRGKGFE